MKNIACTLLLLLGATPLVAGCDDPPPAKTPDDVDEAMPVPVSDPAPTDDGTSGATDDDDETSNVSVDPRISDMCKLPSPNFGFDSASVSADAKATLDSIVKCFNGGPADGKNINLVGHADKVGPESYNRALGQRRAASVGQFLSNAGLSADRINTSSRGEMDATGPETGSAQDRRVEILLADE
ncbi:MAG: OmpA family protein [Myxococcota bacterium]